MSGVGDFFALVGRGGKQIRADYRMQLAKKQAETDYTNGRAQKALAEAAIATDERLQRESMAAKTRAVYGAGNEDMADFASGSALSGLGNIEQATGASQKVFEILMQLAARNAAMKGDHRGEYANLAAMYGQPVEHVKISDGMQFDPYDPAVAPALTAPGAAMVAARNAAAGSQNASADASRARADLYRRGGGGKSSQPTEQLIKAYLGVADESGDVTVDRQKLMGFERFRAQHPELTDGTQALDTFMQAITPGSGQNVAPHGSVTFQPGSPVTTELSPASGHPEPPAAAIAMLKKTPSLRAEFEAKYGVPAALYLGK